MRNNKEEKRFKKFDQCPRCQHYEEEKKYSKRCTYCNKRVYPGTGNYYFSKLYHIWCLNLHKANNRMGVKK